MGLVKIHVMRPKCRVFPMCAFYVMHYLVFAFIVVFFAGLANILQVQRK